jgi:transposase, IS30 family
MKHLTIGQRYQISIYRQTKKQKEIAKLLSVSESTISRELNRNKQQDGSYAAQKAHSIASNRRKKDNNYKIKGDLKDKVNRYLQEDYSPEQVSGYLLKTESIKVSVQGIYNYIWKDESKGGNLYTHLRLGRKYRKKYGKPDKRSLKYANKPSIELRTDIINEKQRIGDWEADTVEGAKGSGYVITLTERYSKVVYIIKVARKTKELVGKAIIKRLKKSPIPVHSITFDNGCEFDDYKSIEKALKCAVYFAHPYSPWERGLNENTNGLIRQYFPKKMDFSTIDQKQAEKVESILNNRRQRPTAKKKIELFHANTNYQSIYFKPKNCISNLNSPTFFNITKGNRIGVIFFEFF